MNNKENKTTNGPKQKAPGYDDTIERDTGHDPSIDDPDPGHAPIGDPDTEGTMGKTEDDENGTDDAGESNFSVGG